MAQNFVSKNGLYQIQVENIYGKDVEKDFLNKISPLKIISAELNTYDSSKGLDKADYQTPIYEREAEDGEYDYSLEKLNSDWNISGYVVGEKSDFKNKDEFEEKAWQALGYYTDYINNKVNRISLTELQTNKEISAIDFAYPELFDPYDGTESQQINDINQLKFPNEPSELKNQEFAPLTKEVSREQEKQVFDKTEFDKWQIQEDKENNTVILLNYKDKENKKLYIPNQADLKPFGITGKVQIPADNLNILCDSRESVVISNKNNEKVSVTKAYQGLGLFCHGSYKPEVWSKNSIQKDAATLKKIDLKGLDIANNTNLSYMFAGQNNLQKIDLSNLDTSSVTNMMNMFEKTSKLNEIKGLESLDTSNVERMDDLFKESGITNIPISNWDTHNVTGITHAFEKTKINNLDLSKWNFDKVCYAGEMFREASGSVTLPENGAINLQVAPSFFAFSDLNIKNMEQFKMPKIRVASGMFWGAKTQTETMQKAVNNLGNELREIDGAFSLVEVKNPTRKLDISNLPTKKLESAKYMFANSDIKITGLEKLKFSPKCNTKDMFKETKDEIANNQTLNRTRNRLKRLSRAKNIGREL